MPNPHTILLSLPTKNIDYPSATLPVLSEALDEKRIPVEKRDINLELKDELLTVRGLKQIYYEVLPFLLTSTTSDERTHSRLANLHHLLEFLQSNVGFGEVVKTKLMLQDRNYVEVFTDARRSQITLLLFALARALHCFSEAALDQANLLDKAGLPNITVEVLERSLRDISDKDPSIVALTVLGIQRKFSLWFSERLKQRFGGKIIMGGADPTMYARAYIMNFPWIDAVFIGQADDTFPLYAEALLSARPRLSSIPNLMYRTRRGNIVRTAISVRNVPMRRANFDGLPLGKYLLPSLPITSSRGCYWGRCDFCVHHKTYGGYSERCIKDVIQDIRVLQCKYGARFFHFTDDTLKAKRAVAIAEGLLSQNIEARFLTYLRFEDDISASDLKTMYSGGFRVVEWGLESAAQKLLRSMKKGISIRTADRILRTASRIGFLSKLMAFHDYPGETCDDLQTTLKFIENHILEKRVRPFFPIRNRLELRVGSSLLSKANREPLFPKVWLPSGELASIAQYYKSEDEYAPKKAILNAFLERMGEVMKRRGVYDTDDENLTLDLVLIDLQESGYQTTLNWI